MDSSKDLSATKIRIPASSLRLAQLQERTLADSPASNTNSPAGNDIRALPDTLISQLRTSATHPLMISWVLPANFILPKNNGDVDVNERIPKTATPIKDINNTQEKKSARHHRKQSSEKSLSDSPKSSSSRSQSPSMKKKRDADDDAGRPKSGRHFAVEYEENGIQSEPIVILDANELDRQNPDHIKMELANLALPTVSSKAGKSLPQLGNLALSSCPGKKVRLNGFGVTMKRAPIQRDLQADFQRLKHHEISTVVNLLNDQELEFLGAKWSDYQSAADSVGINIIRYPIPEGHAPSDMDDFEQKVLLPINDLTLSGKNVLCHCRGGIGRAGLTACCWLLKRGYCVNPSKSIDYIRLRRSKRAIETVEQEDFIHQYFEDYCQKDTN